MGDRVHLDFETRSVLDIKKTGAERYAESAEILCMGYAVNDQKPKLWTPGDPVPDVLSDPGATFHAWNAAFEMAIWDRVGCGKLDWPALPGVPRWRDTMAKAQMAVLPASLAQCGEALRLPADVSKFARGSYLVKKSGLCKPLRGKFNNDPELLKELGEYCVQDVVAERAIGKLLPNLPVNEQRLWELTQTMNQSGVPMDRVAIKFMGLAVRDEIQRLNELATKVSGGAFTTLGQVAKIVAWCKSQGVAMDNLTKDTVHQVLEADPPEPVRTVLRARLAGGLASVKKIFAAENRICKDGTIKGTLTYHGAGTGRWSSRGFQTQNIKRPELSPDEVDRLIRSIAMERYSGEDILTDISNCIRGLIRAPRGKVLMASDYSQIETRVLLWLAGDEKNLEEIRKGLDPYKTMATEIYKTEYDEVTKDQRQVAKAAVLGCGFQLGGQGFTGYAQGYGANLTEQEAEDVVEAYRDKHRPVVTFWYELQEAVLTAVSDPGRVVRCRRLAVRNGKKWLQIRLPSGRSLYYFEPRVEVMEKPWGAAPTFTFYGLDTYTRQWGRTHSYGGRLVENVVQGTARDLIAHGMLTAHAAGVDLRNMAHDEAVAVAPAKKADQSLELLNSCLLSAPSWAEGLPLAVEGWTGKRYRK